MIERRKIIIAIVSGVGLMTVIAGVMYYKPRRNVSPAGENEMLLMMKDEPADESHGPVPGRVVSISAKLYKDTFGQFLHLGQCPSKKMNDETIIPCSHEFAGNEVFLGKGYMKVDVSKVQTQSDITTYVMGGLGTSIGVMGAVSVGQKVNVGVTVETTKKTLNLISTYVMNKGMKTLQFPRPRGFISDSTLYLSEIEIGGNELFLVTLEFDSVKVKVEVQVTITFKILFISISAKLKFTYEKMKTSAKVRVQFRSSWREPVDKTYSTLKEAIPEVEKYEREYLEGPQILRDKSIDDVEMHNFYYFSSWNQSPYGSNLNLALINHDIEFLTQQNLEMLSVIERIKTLATNDTYPPDAVRLLKEKLIAKTEQLTVGLENFHDLSPIDRQALRDIYGENHAPFYYTRLINSLI